MVHVIGRKRGADVLRPLSPEHPDDETFEGLLILRPEGRLFFANAQNVADQVQALTLEHQPRVLALDLSRVPDIEYSALQTLIESEKRATEQGVIVWLAGLNPGVLEVVRRAGFDKQLGSERLMFNARMAIERYQALRAAEEPAAADAARASPGSPRRGSSGTCERSGRRARTRCETRGASQGEAWTGSASARTLPSPSGRGASLRR